MTDRLDLLPWWVRLVWIALFCWVVASHFTHMLQMRGQPRGWHATHLLMALGMIYMFLAWQGLPVSMRFGTAVFLAGAAAVAAFIVLNWIRLRPVNLLWFLQLAGMAAMAYMFALMDPLMDHELTAITLTLAALYVLEAAGWSRRTFAEADDKRLSWIPFQAARGYGPADRHPTRPRRRNVPDGPRREVRVRRDSARPLRAPGDGVPTGVPARRRRRGHVRTSGGGTSARAGRTI